MTTIRSAALGLMAALAVGAIAVAPGGAAAATAPTDAPPLPKKAVDGKFAKRPPVAALNRARRPAGRLRRGPVATTATPTNFSLDSFGCHAWGAMTMRATVVTSDKSEWFYYWNGAHGEYDNWRVSEWDGPWWTYTLANGQPSHEYYHEPSRRWMDIQYAHSFFTRSARDRMAGSVYMVWYEQNVAGWVWGRHQWGCL